MEPSNNNNKNQEFSRSFASWLNVLPIEDTNSKENVLAESSGDGARTAIKQPFSPVPGSSTADAAFSHLAQHREQRTQKLARQSRELFSKRARTQGVQAIRRLGITIWYRPVLRSCVEAMQRGSWRARRRRQGSYYLLACLKNTVGTPKFSKLLGAWRSRAMKARLEWMESAARSHRDSLEATRDAALRHGDVEERRRRAKIIMRVMRRVMLRWLHHHAATFLRRMRERTVHHRRGLLLKQVDAKWLRRVAEAWDHASAAIDRSAVTLEHALALGRDPHLRHGAGAMLVQKRVGWILLVVRDLNAIPLLLEQWWSHTRSFLEDALQCQKRRIYTGMLSWPRMEPPPAHNPHPTYPLPCRALPGSNRVTSPLPLMPPPGTGGRRDFDTTPNGCPSLSRSFQTLPPPGGGSIGSPTKGLDQITLSLSQLENSRASREGGRHSTRR